MNIHRKRTRHQENLSHRSHIFKKKEKRDLEHARQNCVNVCVMCVKLSSSADTSHVR
jgi:hypothetical protein